MYKTGNRAHSKPTSLQTEKRRWKITDKSCKGISQWINYQFPSMSDRIMLWGELKGWEVTGIRANSEEQHGHKSRMTKPWQGVFSHRPSFEERKLWSLNFVQAFCRGCSSKYAHVLLSYTAVPLLIRPGEAYKISTITGCVINGTLGKQEWQGGLRGETRFDPWGGNALELSAVNPPP